MILTGIGLGRGSEEGRNRVEVEGSDRFFTPYKPVGPLAWEPLLVADGGSALGNPTVHLPNLIGYSKIL